MGIVYRCRDQATADLVAVKRVILPEGKLANEYVGWFYKEARALATLDHPGIVHARDFGQLADGSPFLAMDLVTGVSLHDLSQSRLSFPIIWSIIDGVLQRSRHLCGQVFHGDLRPSNVIVEQRVDQAPRPSWISVWPGCGDHTTSASTAKSMAFAPHAGQNAGLHGPGADPAQCTTCGARRTSTLGASLHKLSPIARRSPVIRRSS
jgi:serine/threonine protein kinase